MLFTILWILMAVVLDQLSKYLVLEYLVPVGSYPFLKGILHFTYVENTGAAFGMLKNHRWVFLIISAAAAALILAAETGMIFIPTSFPLLYRRTRKK